MHRHANHCVEIVDDAKTHGGGPNGNETFHSYMSEFKSLNVMEYWVHAEAVKQVRFFLPSIGCLLNIQRIEL